LIYFIIVKSQKYYIESIVPFIKNKMHILQPKHTKLNEKDAQEFLDKLNISKSQLPKILVGDAGLPEGSDVGDIIKIERKEGDKINIYFRVIV